MDAGTHLAAIAQILEDQALGNDDWAERNRASRSRALSQEALRRNGVRSLPSRSLRASDSTSNGNQSSRSNPFAGLHLPADNPRANAAFITRELVSTYLITHAHLDHIAGFVINTASFQHTARPKRLAAMEGTINAIKTHIFNDLIWPNLTDEDGGIGLVSFMRLVEGGDVAIGEGDGRGYIEVCEGLGVKSWSVSHGHRSNSSKRRQLSHPHLYPLSHPHSPRLGPHPHSPRLNSPHPHSHSLLHHHHHHYSHRGGGGDPHSMPFPGESVEKCAYDSTAYFIRDFATGTEVLIFGDVEPDRISAEPRTALVWQEAAPKIARGMLKGILIECSYDDSQSDETLFGHLAPRHLIQELRYLGECVRDVRRQETKRGRGKEMNSKKRKRGGRSGSRGSTASGIAEARALLTRLTKRRHSSYHHQRREGGRSTRTFLGLPEAQQQQSQQQQEQKQQDGQQQMQKQKRKRSKMGRVGEEGSAGVGSLRPTSAGGVPFFISDGIPNEGRPELPPLSTTAGTTTTTAAAGKDGEPNDPIIDDTPYPGSSPVDDDEEEEEDRVYTSADEPELDDEQGNDALPPPRRSLRARPLNRRRQEAEAEEAAENEEEEMELDDDDVEEEEDEEDLPLKGLKIVIIHMKDPFRANLTTGPDIGQSILEQLEGYDDGSLLLDNADDEGEDDGSGGTDKGKRKGAVRKKTRKGKGNDKKEDARKDRRETRGMGIKLGCEFIISKRGQSIYL